jgi:hypothetical protein
MPGGPGTHAVRGWVRLWLSHRRHRHHPGLGVAVGDRFGLGALDRHRVIEHRFRRHLDLRRLSGSPRRGVVVPNSRPPGLARSPVIFGLLFVHFDLLPGWNDHIPVITMRAGHDRKRDTNASLAERYSKAAPIASLRFQCAQTGIACRANNTLRIRRGTL